VRIAFIVQRYGAEVLGGSEYLCRVIAERLASRHQVDVITTCARDYITWKNDYPEGPDRIRGVTVRRFANVRTRDLASFNRYSDWIYSNQHSRDDEMEWLKQQGPWCPGLIDYLQRQHHQYDVLVFFTYLYAPTVLGLRIDPSKSILVPTAHDEPASRLGIFKEVFAAPAGVAYNTEAERRFVHETFSLRAIDEEVIGVGVEPPPDETAERDTSQPTDAGGLGPAADERGFERSAEERELTRIDEGAGPGSGSSETDDAGLAPGANVDSPTYRSHEASRGARFRRRHRLHGPFALYGGRIDPGKGCEELIEYFSSFVAEGHEASLVLMGVKMMPLPEEPYIRFAGQLSEQERFDALAAATVVVVPSPYESLSILALEAFSVETPVLVNARSDVLVEHCRKSNAGLYYADRDEFVECLRLLMTDETLRRALGRNGREYVQRNYRWDVVIAKYERLFAKLRGAPAGRR
jgi:glycosyltransferase involved in cell wall biosynthesis